MKTDDTFSFYVQDFFSSYLPNIKSNSYNTIKTYRYAFVDLLKFFKEEKIEFNHMPMMAFKIEYIEKYIEYLKKKNNSCSTINTKIIAIKSFFDYLEYKSIDYLNISSQVTKIHLLKKDTPIPKYLTEQEVQIILNLDSPMITVKEYVVFLILYYGALRVNELCNLKIDNIKILDKSSFKIEIYNSKNNKNRIVNFECNYGKHIKKYLNSLNTLEGSYLFTNKYGNQYTKKGINYIINKLYCIAKSQSEDSTLFINEKIHPHMLRHSRAMIMLKHGVSLSEIKEYLGHENISTTEIYARLEPSIIEESLVRHAKSINYKGKYTKKEKESLENWLKNL
ncbi:TPA: tyrosine-type recombinase/integrase [Candidatus Ventrenecus stercoripullorum]|nr:tyrosine-type recombinase/integrase [Candidatus Ventrenecus stercoripullorum]